MTRNATPAPGYHVTVRQGRKVAARKHFHWGQWTELGYWLDDQGFNRPDYSVSVSFVDEED